MSVGLHTTVYNWLRELKIPVSKSYIKEQLLSHPDYPSLLSITDTLKDLGIENTAIQIEKDEIDEVPLPFLIHLNSNGGEFVLINKQNKTDRSLDFYSLWSGIILAAEKPENLRNKLNTEWLTKDSKRNVALIFTAAMFTFFILLAQIAAFDWKAILLLLIALSGIFVSWLIVSKALGIENKIADDFCGSEGDCISVIKSNTIEFPFSLGWSDAGIIYFVFLLIELLASSFDNSLIKIYPLLALIAVAALPITMVSVYYQWRVIKRWCRLCLIIVSLLWLQFFIFIGDFNNLLEIRSNNISINEIILSLFFLFLVGSSWLWLKPVIKKSNETESEMRKGQRFKYKVDVFNSLLEKQRKVDTIPCDSDLTFGNSKASLHLLVACSPFCGPCAKAHGVLHDLVETNDMELIVRFALKTINKEDKKNQAVSYILDLLKNKDLAYKKRALHDWYSWMDLEKFQNYYSLNNNMVDNEEELDLLKKWSEDNKIVLTPTIFINGRELPKQYKLEDLKNIIPLLSP